MDAYVANYEKRLLVLIHEIYMVTDQRVHLRAETLQARQAICNV